MRAAVLRAGQPAEAAVWVEDGRPATVHWAAYDDDRAVAVVGCVTAFPEPLPGAATTAWRLRGMATAPQARGRGVGAALLAAVVAHAREVGAQTLWCHARAGAVGFYTRHGFTGRGPLFDVPGIGPHLLMVRDLLPRVARSRP